MSMQHSQTDITMMTNFLMESYRIEGIFLKPSTREVLLALDFVKDTSCDISRLKELLVAWVDLISPGDHLRLQSNENVRVGNHVAPQGGPEIEWRLEQLIDATHQSTDEITVYEVHCRFESLHPFTDGNGRSGRLLTLRHALLQDKRLYAQFCELGWLHTWYYMSLTHHDSRAEA